MGKTFFKVTFIESDYGVDRETEIIAVDKVSDGFDMELMYRIFDDMWNGGCLFDTYEDYVDANDEDDLVRDHFDTIVNATSEGWYASTMASIINAIYPEMNAEVISIDDNSEYVFYW